MSNNLQKELPMNSNCSGVLQNRSISDVILPLRMSCLDSDYKAAVKELMVREEGLLREKGEIVANLREKNGILEADLGDWKIRYCAMEEECCRWKRSFYENDELLKELRREVCLTMEKEERDSRRHELLLGEVQDLEGEKEKYNRKVLDLSHMVDELKRKLKEKEKVKEVEIDKNVGRKNTELKAQLVDLEGLRENVELNGCMLEIRQEGQACKRVDDGIKQLEVQVKTRCAENEGMQEISLYMKEQKAKYDAHVEELRKSNEIKDENMRKLLDFKDRLQSQFEGMKIVNDVHMKELQKENEGLGVKNKELAAQLGQAKEKLSKLERDMFTFMRFELDRDPNFASAPVGKVFSGIIKALDAEKSNLTCNAGVAKGGIPQEAVFVSQSCLEPTKQSREAVERLKWTSVPVNIDRGDKYGNPLHINGVRNKRQWLGSLNEQRNHVGSRDDTLNPVHKMMKRKHALCEIVQQEPSHAVLSASRSDHVSNISQMQNLATLEQFKGNYRGKDKVSSSGFLNGNGSKNSYGTSKATEPRAEELMTSILQSNLPQRIGNAADMASAVHRLQKPDVSGVNGFTYLGSKGLEECDVGRVMTPANALIDGEPNSKLKESANQLRQEGCAACRGLAPNYSEQTHDIYKKTGNSASLIGK